MLATAPPATLSQVTSIQMLLRTFPTLHPRTLALLAAWPFLLAAAAGPALLVAQGSPCGDEVHFAKGTTSATVTGTIKSYEYCNHVLRANEGETLRVWLSGAHRDRAIVVIRNAVDSSDLSPDGEPITLPTTGPYTIRVLMYRTFARRGLTVRYSLRIQVR